jgi:hypothetical protein
MAPRVPSRRPRHSVVHGGFSDRGGRQREATGLAAYVTTAASADVARPPQMNTLDRPTLVINVAVGVSEGYAQTANAPEPAVPEAAGNATPADMTAPKVAATHGPAEVPTAKTCAEMATPHSPAAMATSAASARNSVGGNSGTSQRHCNNDDRDSVQQCFLHDSNLSVRDNVDDRPRQRSVGSRDAVTRYVFAIVRGVCSILCPLASACGDQPSGLGAPA